MSRASAATAVAAAVAADLGLTGPLHRLPEGTTSAVFRTRDAVLSVAAPGTDPASPSARIALAAAICDVARVVRPWPVRQPIERDGSWVSVWVRVPALPGELDWTSAGDAVRSLHDVRLDRLDDRVRGGLRDADDLDDVRRAVEAARAGGRLSGRHARALSAVCDRLQGELTAVAGVDAGPVLLHGDLHAANLLSGPDGVVLCDLDEVQHGSRLHDLGFLVDPARPTVPVRHRSAFEAGYGAPLPAPGVARTAARVAHLRRTVRVLGQARTAREQWYHRVRLQSWVDQERDWSLDLHPVIVQRRSDQVQRRFKSWL